MSKNNFIPGGIIYFSLRVFWNLIVIHLSVNKSWNEGNILICIFISPIIKLLNLHDNKIDINGINSIYIITLK